MGCTMTKADGCLQFSPQSLMNIIVKVMAAFPDTAFFNSFLMLGVLLGANQIAPTLNKAIQQPSYFSHNHSFTPLATAGLSPVSIVLLCPECHRVGTTQCVDFSDWLLYLVTRI